MLIQSKKNSTASLFPYVATFLAILVVLAIAWILDRSEQKRFKQQNRGNVLHQLSTVRANLEAALNQRLFLMRGLVAYISSVNPDISQAEFENLTRIIVAKQPGIPSAALFKDSICTHLYPLAGQEEALGFEPLKVPNEREAFQRAINTRKTVVSGPVDLFPQGGKVLITRTPIFLTPFDQKPESGAYWGMVSIGIDFDILLEEAGIVNPKGELKYTIRGQDGLGKDGAVFWGNKDIFAKNPVILDVKLPNGSWQIAAIPLGGWQKNNPISRRLWLGSSLVAILVGILMYILVSAPRRLREAVKQATIALRKNEELLEQRITERTTELAKAKEKAEVANLAKSRFIANMSHELRTPLNAILGFSQIMKRQSSLSQEIQENIKIISRSGEYLLSLINDILELAKIEAGKQSFRPNNFDVYFILDEIKTLFEIKAKDKGLELIFEIDETVPRYICTDETKLRQVLINLLNNAIKFTFEGRIFVKVKTQGSTEILPVLETQKSVLGINNYLSEIKNQTINTSKLLFTVEDTGVGIAAAELNQVFEIFSQTESGKRSQEGTGLGLSITRAFVQLMGGNITVNSELKKGSIFAFDIKVNIVDSTEVKVEKIERHPIELQPNQPTYKILIVDDIQINRQLLIKLLEPLKFQLKEAINGQKAIEIWHDWHPDLIWMDMKMPIMNGYDATQYIKGTIQGRKTKIIALTASVLEEEKSIILSAGCDDFVRKPFRESMIFETMKKHLGVEYIYAEEEEQAETNKIEPLKPEDLIIMAPEWLEKLYYASKALNDDMALGLIAEIPETHSLLANQLTSLVDNFQLKPIKTIIELIL
ncbi:MAG: ATP-binding protein [Trichodesmium sp. MO_231.B1]|nr:ATP-binding protein [Trichodesmium sp. MO_231.B1]